MIWLFIIIACIPFARKIVDDDINKIHDWFDKQ